MGRKGNENRTYYSRLETFNKLQIVVVVVSGVISLQWVIYQVTEYFFFDGLGENSIIGGILFTVLAGLLVSIVLGLQSLKNRIIFNKPLNQDELNVYKEIIDRAMYKIDDEVFLSLILEKKELGKWEDVLRIGEVSSKLFWKMARYDVRIKNGDIMLSALDELEKKEKKEGKRNEALERKKATVLIDDVGYTYVGKKDFVKAEENISSGLRIAEEIKDHVLISKAYRHMSGINLQLAERSSDRLEKERFISVAEEKYRESQKEQRHVSFFKIVKRIELKAFLYYLLGRILTVKSDYSDALKNYDKAKKLFDIISDDAHGVKIFYQRGQVFEKSGHNIDKVIQQYKTGYDLASQLVDNEQILKNGCALCRLYGDHGDKASFNMYYNNVYHVAVELKKDTQLKELDNYYGKMFSGEVRI